jgi:hypothetical protein
MAEIRLAIRRLTHRPAAAIASIVTLAGAIGAAAATWSLLSALLLHPLPVRDPASLFLVGEAHHSGSPRDRSIPRIWRCVTAQHFRTSRARG